MKDSIDIGIDNPKSKSRYRDKIFKHPIISGVIFGIIVFAFIFSSVTNKQAELEYAKALEEQSYQDKMFSEAHTKMQYFLETSQTEATVESAAKLIAHTMETGCSTSYEILESIFDTESMEFLQDYLNGRDCGKYSSAPVVCIERAKNYYMYLVRLGSDDARYNIQVKFVDFKVSSFNISVYIEKNKIEIEKG